MCLSSLCHDRLKRFWCFLHSDFWRCHKRFCLRCFWWIVLTSSVRRFQKNSRLSFQNFYFHHRTEVWFVVWQIWTGVCFFFNSTENHLKSSGSTCCSSEVGSAAPWWLWPQTTQQTDMLERQAWQQLHWILGNGVCSLSRLLHTDWVEPSGSLLWCAPDNSIRGEDSQTSN